MSPFVGMLRAYRLGTLLVVLTVLGGTNQSEPVLRYFAYLASGLTLAWLVADPDRRPLRALVTPLGAFLALWGVAFLIALLPLPPGLWSELPGRDYVVEGFALLGAAAPWLPLSLDPVATRMAMAALLPVAAIYAVVMLSGSKRERSNALLCLLGSGGFSAALGIMQGVMGVGSLPFHGGAGTGEGAGVFVNPNHNGSFLLMLLPLAIWLALFRWKALFVPRGTPRSPRGIFALACAILYVAAIPFTLSIYAYILLAALPVMMWLVFSQASVSGRAQRSSVAKSAAVLVVIVLAGAVVIWDGLSETSMSQAFDWSTGSSVDRPAIWRTTARGIDRYGLAGSGPGTFERAYKVEEQPVGISEKFVPHAHNDYLQTVLEFGVLSVPIIGLGVWLVGAGVWRSRARGMAGPLLLGLAVVLGHSLVDYSLRTLGPLAAAVLFAAMLQRRLIDRAP